MKKRFLFYIISIIFALSFCLFTVSCSDAIVISKKESDTDVEKESDEVNNIRLNISEYSLVEGEVMQISAIMNPVNTKSKPEWTSSDDSVAEVDSDGRVSAKSQGVALITASINGLSANCKVSVSDAEEIAVSVKSVSIDKDSEEVYTLSYGQTVTIRATVYPDDASDKRIIWTATNPRVATVDSNGVVTAIGNGNTTIIATTVDGGKEASCHYKMTVPVIGAQVQTHELVLKVGDSKKITGNVLPYDENQSWLRATNKDKSWASVDPSIAKVSSSGKITAVSPGSTFITLTTEEGHFIDYCQVYVYKESRNASYALFSQSNLVLTVGAEYNPDIQILDENKTPDRFAKLGNMLITSSDESVATFDGTTIVALSEGTTKLRIYNKITRSSSTCDLVVTSDVFNCASLNIKEKEEIEVGSFYRIDLNPNPYNATLPTLKWTSSDDSVAEVYPGGVVKAKSQGLATITVYDENNTVLASILISVVPKSEENLYSEETNPQIVLGESYKFDITVNKGGRMASDLIITSSDKNVISIVEGKALGVGAGSAEVTISTKDASMVLVMVFTVIEESASAV